MRTQLICSLILLFQFTSLFSQEKNEDNFSEDHFLLNNIFLDVLGGGAALSLGYERHFLKSNIGFFNLRVGAGINEVTKICGSGVCGIPGKKYTIFYQQVTYNVGRDKKFFEVGVGGSLALRKSSVFYYPHAFIGYRVILRNTPRLMGKIYLNIPFDGFENIDFIFMPFGISFGHRL